jgi:hypothetical protein
MKAPAVAAVLGALIVFWVASPRFIDPREVAWALHGDWQVHFLGWQFFRHEPWQWPPGAIQSMLEPIGTALGYTDSIPLAAFLLKPIQNWLPNPFQYLGLWFLVCFVLQGWFGARVISTWTERMLLQVLGAMFFVFFPPFASRIAHPALCAQWLLLWALWLNWRSAPPLVCDARDHATLGLVSALVHPYLSVMTFALLVAAAARRWLSAERRSVSVAVPLLLTVASIGLGWWASGLFTFSSTDDLKALDAVYSMNLVSIVNPGEYSSLLSRIEVVSLSQFGEGFQYFGVGVHALCIAAIVIAVRRRSWRTSALPLTIVLVCCAVYSVLPQVAIGRRVLLDISSDNAVFAVFRSTGRFFWPVGYTVLAAALGVVARELSFRAAAVILAGTFALQLYDLHDWWLRMHDGSRAPSLYALDTRFNAPEWGKLLPRYRRIREYYPEFCRGPVAAPWRDASYLASLHRLSINDGFAARVAPSRQSAACRSYGDDFARGYVDDHTVYLVAPTVLSEFQSRLGDAVHCRVIDSVSACVSARSLTRGGAE